MALLKWLRRTNPRNGRVVCEDWLTHNIGGRDKEATATTSWYGRLEDA